jgi:hypothetical protein
MRSVLIVAVILALVLALAVAAVGPALAGQPDVECEDFSSSPGHASDARGSAFAEDGVAGQHYAGEQPQNSQNSHSVSQYDVACEKVSSH